MSARIISTVGRAIDVIVAGMTVSHLRFAAGVCVLVAGLLMGMPGARAVADPDSSGSTANSTDTNQQPSTAAEQPEERRHGHQGRQERRHGHQGRQERRHGHQGRQERRHGHQGRQERLGRAAAVPDQVAPVAAAVPDQVAPVAAAVPDQVAPVAAAVPDQVAPVAAAVPDQVAPVAAAVPDQVAPVTTAVAPVAAAVPKSRRSPLRCRFPIWSGRFLTSSRRFRTCSPRLPVRSSRSRAPQPGLHRSGG